MCGSPGYETVTPGSDRWMDVVSRKMMSRGVQIVAIHRRNPTMHEWMKEGIDRSDLLEYVSGRAAAAARLGDEKSAVAAVREAVNGCPDAAEDAVALFRVKNCMVVLDDRGKGEKYAILEDGEADAAIIGKPKKSAVVLFMRGSGREDEAALLGIATGFVAACNGGFVVENDCDGVHTFFLNEGEARAAASAIRTSRDEKSKKSVETSTNAG